MKKQILTSTCLLLAALMAASCGGQTKEMDMSTDAADSVTEAETQALTRIDMLGERDYAGAAFVILDDGGNININTPDETLEGDIVNDTILKRNLQIAEMYNVEFDYQHVSSYADRANMVRNSVLSDDPAYDLLFSILPESIAPIATEGVLANLCAIEALSLNESWWSPLIYENCRLGNKMYYATGDISPISYRAPACYYVNETLLDQYGISKDEIYDHVENGTWTLDVLNTYAGDLDADLNNDGKLYTDDDFFGVLNEDNALTAACFMVASGFNLSSIDEDGHLTVDLNNESVVNAIEKLKGVLSNVKRSGNPALHTAFMEDRAVFMMHYASSGYTRYRDMKSDYLTLPLPKYDEAQESYRSLLNTWCNAFVCVPANADTERAGIIMEAMAYLSHDMLRPAAFDMALKEKGSRNERDARMLDIIFNSLYLDFNSIMEFGGSLTPIGNAVFKDTAYVSAAEKVESKMITAMEAFEKAWIGEE